MTSVATIGAETTPLSGRGRALAIGTVLAAMTLAVLDAGMTNVALPSLAKAFAVTPDVAIRAVTAYQAGLVMSLLPLGALGERYGHARVFSLSIGVFALAALASALAPSLTWLIVSRWCQGLGGAGIMALGMALLRFTVAERQMGRAIGWNALNVAVASAVAPSLGAVVLALADWRWLFAVHLPIAALSIVGARSLPATSRSAAPPDFASMALSAVMFGALIAAAQAAMVLSRLAPVLLAAAVLALVLLLRRERRKAAPLLPLDLLRNESFRLSAIASVGCFAAQTAGQIALPFLLQHQLRQSPLASGLLISAWPLGVAIAAPLAGRLSDRTSTAWLCGIGAGALATGLAACATVTHLMAILPSVTLAGAGFGLFQTPNNRNLFLAAPAHRSGAAGGMQGSARVTGQTAGALTMAFLLGQLSLESALPVGFAAAAVLALLAGIVSVLRIFT